MEMYTVWILMKISQATSHYLDELWLDFRRIQASLVFSECKCHKLSFSSNAFSSVTVHGCDGGMYCCTLSLLWTHWSIGSVRLPSCPLHLSSHSPHWPFVHLTNGVDVEKNGTLSTTWSQKCVVFWFISYWSSLKKFDSAVKHSMTRRVVTFAA